MVGSGVVGSLESGDHIPVLFLRIVRFSSRSWWFVIERLRFEEFSGIVTRFGHP